MQNPARHAAMSEKPIHLSVTPRAWLQPRGFVVSSSRIPEDSHAQNTFRRRNTSTTSAAPSGCFGNLSHDAWLAPGFPPVRELTLWKRANYLYRIHLSTLVRLWYVTIWIYSDTHKSIEFAVPQSNVYPDTCTIVKNSSRDGAVGNLGQIFWRNRLVVRWISVAPDENDPEPIRPAISIIQPNRHLHLIEEYPGTIGILVQEKVDALMVCNLISATHIQDQHSMRLETYLRRYSIRLAQASCWVLRTM